MYNPGIVHQAVYWANLCPHLSSRLGFIIIAISIIMIILKCLFNSLYISYIHYMNRDFDGRFFSQKVSLELVQTSLPNTISSSSYKNQLCVCGSVHPTRR